MFKVEPLTAHSKAGGVSDLAGHREAVPVNSIFHHHLQKTSRSSQHLMALYQRNDFARGFCP